MQITTQGDEFKFAFFGKPLNQWLKQLVNVAVLFSVNPLVNAEHLLCESSCGLEVVAGLPPAVRRRTHLPDLRRQVRLGGTAPASSYTCAIVSELTHIAFWYIKMKCKEPKIT
ncbi:hypothetical protein H8959_020429 [Pygathrix nigripes]